VFTVPYPWHLPRADWRYGRDGVWGPHEEDGVPGSGDRDTEYAPVPDDAACAENLIRPGRSWYSVSAAAA